MNTEQLKEFELLRHLNEQQLIMLANNSKVIKLIPDQILFNAGDTDHYHYFLIAGELQIDSGGPAPTSLIAHSADAMRPVDHFRPRRHDVYARSSAAVLEVDTATLKELLKEAPGDSYEVKKTLREDQPEDKQLLLDIYSDLRNNKLVLPSLPEVAIRIRRMIDDGTNNARKISQAVNTDPVVATKLIKAANSPMYRGTKEFETSTQAIVRLGMQTTKQLVTSFTVKELFKTSTPVLKQRMDTLWQHSIEIAALSYVLAQNVRGLDPEQGLLAGLLHDIGVVPILMYAHHYPNLMNDPQTLEKTIKELKTELGPLILKRWGFNEEMVAAATHSENWNYQPEEEGKSEPDFADLVMVAHLNQYMVSDEKLARLNKIPAFRRLFPGENTACHMADILEQAQNQLEDTRQLLVA